MQSRKNVTLRWNYFASSHGKGPVDGVGGIIKRYVTSRMIQRKFIVQDIDSFKAVSEGCAINVITMRKSDIDSFNLKHKLYTRNISTVKACKRDIFSSRSANR